MKVSRLVALCAIIVSMWIGDYVRQAFAYFGLGGIWAEGPGQYVSQNYNGTEAGRDNAYTDYTALGGLVRLGPGTDAFATGFGTIPYSVAVVRPSWRGYDIAGRPLRWFDRLGTQFFKADSTGVNVAGVVRADSSNSPGGIFVGNTRITKIIKGIFSHDFGSVANGTTVDETQAVSETGLDVASNWAVTVVPQFDLPAGVTVTGRVSADNQIKLRASNTCATTQDPPPGTYAYLAVK